MNDACVTVCACRLVLLSAQRQGGVNGLSAISGAQLVYPNEHNSNSSQLQRGHLPIDAAPKLEITGDMNIHENNAPHSRTVNNFCRYLHACLHKQ